MDLFVQPTIDFPPLEKRAASVDLPEDPNKWPFELLQELYKQVSYVSDFEPHVQMDKVDAERGYGFGHVVVSNRTQMQAGVTPEEQQAAGVRVAKIPIIIKEGKLLPFDLVVTDTNTVQPLTESRLRQSLFRPQMFDVSARTPGDPSLVEQLYPPNRDSSSFGGGTVLSKQGSVGSLLSAVLPSVSETEMRAFRKEASDPHVRASFLRNAEASLPSLQQIYEFVPTSLHKTAEALQGAIRPTVAQVRKIYDGYEIKTASHHCWDPHMHRVTRGELVQEFGPKLAMDVDSGGSVTMAEGATAGEEMDTVKFSPVTVSGFYKVRTTEGDDLLGYVIPRLLNIDGSPMPLSLFTNGSQAAIQGSIHGIKMAEGSADLPSTHHPMGYGVFFADDKGEITATIPMLIKGSFSELPEGDAVNEPPVYDAETFDGRPAHVSLQPYLQRVVGIEEEGRMLIPSHFKWLPLEKAGGTALVSGEEVAEKTATAKVTSTVYIRASSPNCFSFEGYPIQKLAYQDTNFLNLDDAMFLLAGLGVDQGYGTTKLAHAISAAGPVTVQTKHSINTAEALHKEASKRAADRLKELPVLRVSLVKEAAVLTDPSAVDTVLSLGFINPENLVTFVSYLPIIEETQSRLCNLLIAARLGLQDIPVSALERTVRSVEDVLEGLRTLAFQG